MRNYSLFTLLFLFTTTQLLSQSVRYGFRAGVNASEISGYEFEAINTLGGTPGTRLSTADDPRIGFSAAFMAEIPFNETFSFQPELAISSQGGDNSALRLSYLQLPLGLKFNFNKLFIIAGPQAGLKISDSEQSDIYESIDFLAFGAIGYNVTNNIFLEARFTKGLTEIFTEGSAIPQPVPTASTEDGNAVDRSNFLVNNTGTNTYLTLSIGYKM